MMHYRGGMRTTVNLDPDVEAAVERLRRDEGLGVSEAVNALARRGIPAVAKVDYVFTPVTYAMGLSIDVTDTGEVLELLDDLDRRGQ